MRILFLALMLVFYTSVDAGTWLSFSKFSSPFQLASVTDDNANSKKYFQSTESYHLNFQQTKMNFSIY